MTPQRPAGPSALDRAKAAAAERALGLIEPGMKVGLGTGSTADFLLKALGRRVRDNGLSIVGVPTSARTAATARQEGIPLATLEEVGWLDLTIDGADEFDANLNLIKGGGGALLLEKIVAAASDRMVVIADAAKEVAALGAFPLPVEVVRFGWSTTRRMVTDMLSGFEVLGQEAVLRLRDGAPFVTDEGHYILDLQLNRIEDPRHLTLLLNQIPGVVENGLFVDLCDLVVIGHADGRIELRDMLDGALTEEAAPTADRDNLFSDL